jgi:cell division protein FtsX
MKRIFIMLVLLVAATAALGLYLGWFAVASTTTVDGKSNITVTVDKDKIKADEQKAKDKVKDLGQGVKEKATETVEKVR